MVDKAIGDALTSGDAVIPEPQRYSIYDASPADIQGLILERLYEPMVIAQEEGSKVPTDPNGTPKIEGLTMERIEAKDAATFQIKWQPTKPQYRSLESGSKQV